MKSFLLLVSCVTLLSTGSIEASSRSNEYLSFEELEASWQGATTLEQDDNNGVSLENSCASIGNCKDCAATYSCHWCDHDAACHARGSVYGCSWGSSCNKKEDDNNDKKENSTCASQMTCSDCALSSHLCHWCEHDNACHARGSPYGCMYGIDCYSNDRCRRTEPEKFKKFVVTEIPTSRLILVLPVAAVIILCCSCCHFCIVGNIKGAYDDLATIAMTSLPPPVVETSSAPASYSPLSDEQEAGDDLLPNIDEEANLPAEETQASEPKEDQSEDVEETTDYVLMDETAQDQEMTPLLDPTPSESTPRVQEPRHMKTLYRICSFGYYISVTLVLVLLVVVIAFYPKRPVYNVCNDAVAWKKIIEKIAAFKLDLGFEILISVSNPNRVNVAMDNATGSFSFEGKPVGTFMIPPGDIDSMAITDVMLITHVTPDKYSAVKMADAYWNGNLILEAQFNATLRVPSLWNFTKSVSVDNITVYVNELSDRSLCSCPTWDDHKNGSGFFELF